MSYLVIDKIIKCSDIYHAKDIVSKELKKWFEVYEEDNIPKIINAAQKELKHVIWLYEEDNSDIYKYFMLNIKKNLYDKKKIYILSFLMKKEIFWIAAPDIDYVYYEKEWYHV